MAEIKLDKLATEIAKGLQQYNDEVIADINKIENKLVRQSVQELKAKSPRKTGKYAESWTSKTTKNIGQPNSKLIYNKIGRLTHLLEYGHVKRGGGRVEGKAHIRPVEEELSKSFLSEVKKILKG